MAYNKECKEKKQNTQIRGDLDMNSFRTFGKDLGKLVGTVVAAPLYLASEITDSDFMRDVADTAVKVSSHTGGLIADVAQGTGKCIGGVINNDGKAIGEGLGQVLEASANTAVGMGKGMVHVVCQGAETAGAILSGDTETAIKTGKELAKVALVGAFAVGIGDVIEGVMDLDTDDYKLVENENTHYVTPHNRTLPDGRVIWVDGDGNTAIDRDYGWTQSNPDYRVKA